MTFSNSRNETKKCHEFLIRNNFCDFMNFVNNCDLTNLFTIFLITVRISNKNPSITFSRFLILFEKCYTLIENKLKMWTVSNT